MRAPTGRPHLAWLALLLLVASLWAPVACADSGELSFPGDFRKAHMEVAITLPNATARQVRFASDQLVGDRNGNVSAQEARDFGQFAMSSYGASLAATLQGNLTLDGRTATNVTVSDLAFTGITGLVDSETLATARLAADLYFVPDAGDYHALLLRSISGDLAGTADNGTPAVTVSIHAPSGYRIASHNGTSDGRLMAGLTILSYSDDPAHPRDVLVRFEPVPIQPQGDPGLGLPALVLALVGLAVARRVTGHRP